MCDQVMVLTMDRRALLSASTALFSIGVSGCLSRIDSAGSDDAADDRGSGYYDLRLGAAEPLEIDTAPEDHQFPADQALEYEYIEETDEFVIGVDGRTFRRTFEEAGAKAARQAGYWDVLQILEREGLKNKTAPGFGKVYIDELDADRDEFDTPERGVNVWIGKTYSVADRELTADDELEIEELAAVVPRYGDATIRFDPKPYSARFPITCIYEVTQQVR